MEKIKINHKTIDLDIILKLSELKQQKFIEDCTNSCFSAGCCYETRGALTKQEDKPQYDFTTVEDCTDSCFNAGCCYETRGALTKQEDFNFTPKRKKLASVHLEITHSCNHKCFYCFNTSNKNIPINKTTIDEIFKISDSLIITGGEPFINPKQVVDIVKYATSLRFKNISINTNASLIEKETILELYKINPKISFLISIPTVNNQHYEEIVGTNDLEKVLNNIKLLLNTFGQQNIVGNMVIHKLNMYDISETAETLYKMGLRCLKHSFMAPYKESKKYIIDDKDIDYVFRSLAENKNKYNWYMFGSTHAFPLCRIPNILLNNKYPFVKCGAGNAIASISTDGLMYSCPSMNNNAIRITDFINNKANLISHKEIIQNIQKPCKDCGLLAYCGAGCMCENQIISGSLFSAPLYAKELTEEEILIRKVSLGIPCNINDVLDFEKVNELYSRIKFCNTWLNEDLILFSNELVEKIEKNEFSTINSKKIMQFLFKIHQISHAA